MYRYMNILQQRKSHLHTPFVLFVCGNRSEHDLDDVPFVLDVVYLVSQYTHHAE